MGNAPANLIPSRSPGLTRDWGPPRTADVNAVEVADRTVVESGESPRSYEENFPQMAVK